MEVAKYLSAKELKVIELGAVNSESFVSFYTANKDEVETLLRKRGAIKFTGVRIESKEDFQYIVDSIGEKFLNYIDGNSPRTKLSDKVYTSTEYNQDQKITMHNELSYSAKWPNRLFFSCIQPAESGGETLLADSREILQNMNPNIVRQVESKGVTYIRNLHAGQGIGPSWQDTFETESKEEVEKLCRKLSIEFEWSKYDEIRLRQSRKGIITHRTTGEKIWFNQIDQFHPCQLGDKLYKMLSVMYQLPDEYPTYVTYGDGSEIAESMVKEIIATIDKVTIAPKWNKNELLLVDNELVSHGRSPYTGNRSVLVAMSL
ncbi:SyrP-like protein [Fulvivirga imtechensis AK7]|uniref:SyrP-like protein n=1 Tax=Fulvivirga imtechensis AK7 TaxID=1237149 RepID=L8JVS7_9BACT|nr:TauD/TfdA family dioxygenase [Fulvivirga imtechensis]ELR72278.1 SyrP-like protein [Fulvivirga imtechensis AK7]